MIMMMVMRNCASSVLYICLSVLAETLPYILTFLHGAETIRESCAQSARQIDKTTKETTNKMENTTTNKLEEKNYWELREVIYENGKLSLIHI